MPRLIYTNELGQSIKFSDRPPYVLTKIEGLGDLDADIQTQKAPYQDGETHIDTLFEPRYINMEISIVGENVDDLRRQLSKVMNPKVNGVLRYEEETIVKEIECINEHVPKYPTKNKFHHVAIVDLIAPNPYWRDPQTVSRALRAYEGKFKLPTTFPIEFGISGDTTILWNEGDADAPVTIDIQGPVTNPQVINKTTGQYIRVNRSLSADEVLHIDTGRPRRVEIYRDGDTIENAMGYLDHNSDFWELVVGANEIQYIADAGNADAIVAVAWQNRYVGV